MNSLYKAELIHAKPAWPSTTEVEFETLKWVHWWNNSRLHGELGYRTPVEVEQAYYAGQESPSLALAGQASR